MEKETWDERYNKLMSELNAGLVFHDASFKEIDAKAKYWLTFCLPGFVGLVGYALQEGTLDSFHITIFVSAVGTCLLIATFAFASTLISETVRGGMVMPEDGKIESLMHYTQSEELWRELQRRQAAERLDALIKNEGQNDKKSRRLKRAEKLLFYGLPTAACLAIGTALLDTCSAQWGVTTTAARIATGTAVGTCAAAAAATFPSILSHLRSLVSTSVQ